VTVAVTGMAYSRAGLLGNPSDCYGGKAIALPVCNFRARVVIEPAESLRIEPGPADLPEFPTLREASASFQALGCDGGVRLLRAAIIRFTTYWGGFSELPEGDPRLRFAMRYETNIPRQVGLSGSSALVIAALRALMTWFDVEIPPAELAELALAAELEELRIVAGPMDRVVQAYEGLVLMDLREPRGAASYRLLDPGLLPPLFIAWEPRGGEPSGKAHGALRAQWNRDDEELRKVMLGFRDIVDRGVRLLERGEHEAFRELVDLNFDTRSRFFPISDRDREVVAVTRSRGAAAKLCGSGGAVLGVLAEERQAEGIEAELRERGFGFVRPWLNPAAEP
jgi:glucuronokinase